MSFCREGRVGWVLKSYINCFPAIIGLNDTQ